MRETLREILGTLRLIIHTAVFYAADAAEILAFVSGENRTDWEVYRSGLYRLAMAMILLPITLPFWILIGIPDGVVVFGLLWAIATLLFGILLGPLAIIVGFVFLKPEERSRFSVEQIKDAGMRYLKQVLKVIFIELFTALFLFLFFSKNFPKLPFVLALLAAIVVVGRAVLGEQVLNIRQATTVAVAGFIICLIIYTLALRLPMTSRWTWDNAVPSDNSIHSFLTSEKKVSGTPAAKTDNTTTANVPIPLPRAMTIIMITVSEEEAARGFTLMAGMTAQTISAPSIAIEASQEYVLLDTQFNEYPKPTGRDRLIQSVPGPLTVKAIHDGTFFKIRRS